MTPRLLLAALALSLPAATPAAETYDLRGPAPVKGAVYEARTHAEIKDAKLTIDVKGQEILLKQSIDDEQVQRVKVLAVEGYAVTKAEVTVVKNRVVIDTTLPTGQGQSDDKAGELDKQVYLTELKDGKWKNTLVDATPTDEQKKKLARVEGPTGVEMYPAEAVAVGHAWTTSAADARAVVGDGVSAPGGKVDHKFLRVEEVGGEQCAVIESTGKIKGTVPEPGKAVAPAMAFDFKAVTYRSLKTGLDVKGTVTGAMKLTGTVQVGGNDADTTLEGKVTVETAEAKAK